MPTIRSRNLLAAAAFAAAFARPAACQAGLESAGGTTSLVARDFSALTVEAAQTSLTLLLQTGRLGVPNTWDSNLRVQLSAEQGKRDFLVEGHWVPGLELEERLVSVWNDADVDGGYRAGFVSLGYEVNGNVLARMRPDSVIEKYEKTGHTVEAGAGFNWAPRERGPVLGVSATAGRGLSVPVARRTSQVCTQQAAGTDGDGSPVFVSSCQNRYVGEVQDTWTGEFRVDVVSPPMPLRIGGRADEVRRLRSEVDSTLELSGSVTFDERVYAINVRETRLAESIGSLEQDVERKGEALERAQAGEGPDVVAAAERELAEARSREADAKNRLEEVRGLRDKVSRAEELASNGPMLSLLTSASTEVASGSKPIHGIAIGPMLHPPLTPLKVVAGLLFEFDDLTNATGEMPDWDDRFAIRLYIGVPF